MKAWFERPRSVTVRDIPRSAPADLFLLGSAYCGSTHLGALLEANLDAAYAGELAHLPAFVDRFRLFDTPLGCLTCQAEERVCPRWTPAVAAAVQAAGPAAAAATLRTHNNASMIVDGSKWPEWLRLAVRDRPSHPPRVAAVVAARSPFGYVLSARGATGEPGWVVASWWRDVYIDALRTLNLLGVPYVVVRNEDVRADPGRPVASVAALVGQEAPPGPLRPAAPTHSIGGNVFVQHGYREESARLLAKIGLAELDSQAWKGERAAAVAREATTTAALKPTTRAEALGLASELMQCPQLVETAQLLGYSMSLEVDRFLEGCASSAAAA